MSCQFIKHTLTLSFNVVGSLLFFGVFWLITTNFEIKLVVLVFEQSSTLCPNIY